MIYTKKKCLLLLALLLSCLMQPLTSTAYNCGDAYGLPDDEHIYDTDGNFVIRHKKTPDIEKMLADKFDRGIYYVYRYFLPEDTLMLRLEDLSKDNLLIDPGKMVRDCKVHEWDFEVDVTNGIGEVALLLPEYLFGSGITIRYRLPQDVTDTIMACVYKALVDSVPANIAYFDTDKEDAPRIVFEIDMFSIDDKTAINPDVFGVRWANRGFIYSEWFYRMIEIKNRLYKQYTDMYQKELLDKLIPLTVPVQISGNPVYNSSGGL